MKGGLKGPSRVSTKKSICSTMKMLNGANQRHAWPTMFCTAIMNVLGAREKTSQAQGIHSEGDAEDDGTGEAEAASEADGAEDGDADGTEDSDPDAEAEAE